jgi:hypothetical protein
MFVDNLLHDFEGLILVTILFLCGYCSICMHVYFSIHMLCNVFM